MNTSARNLATILTAVACTLSLSSLSAAGTKLTARVAEPFEIAGKPYPAGSLVVEHLRDYTPSTSLSAVWVGSEFVGVLRADRVVRDGISPTGSLTFERDSKGVLVLVGYASAAHGVHGEFRFQAAAVPSEVSPAASGPPSSIRRSS